MMMPKRIAKFIFKDHFKTLFWVMASLYAYNYASKIDLYFRPIVLGFKIDLKSSYRSGTFMFLSGDMTLDRKGATDLSERKKFLEDRCEFDGLSIKDSRGQKVTYSFMEPPEMPDSADRLDGPQPWGPWKIYLGLPPGVTETSATVSHECRWVWPFDTPEIGVQTLVVNGKPKLGMTFDMTRRVQTWHAYSTLWENMPIEKIREKQEGDL
jgi:hypothetical protein